MMIMTRHTRPADIAVFAACGFEEVTCATSMSRVEEDTIIGIPFRLLVVVLRRDERLGNHTLVNENEGQDNNPGNPEFVDI